MARVEDLLDGAGLVDGDDAVGVVGVGAKAGGFRD